MAQDEQPPGGLLSKVVKFVRNPTVSWSDLDQPEDKESHYSKQMLKEMIERKRANDFVRRREFDQLRKLRQRNALGAAGDLDAAGRVSFFQSSLPSNQGDRAGTLKKIDEIEAQMSQQWWKGKDQGLPPPAQTAQAVALNAAQHARQYATTVHAVLPDTPIRDTDFAATDISPMAHLHAGVAESGDLLAVDDDLTLDWPTGPVQPLAEEVVVHDPALEEAAIRFANGDDAGAASALQALLVPGAHTPAQDGIWMALFDLYRATDQRTRFDAAAADFVAQAGRAAPAWSPAGQREGAPIAKAPHWVSPGVLGVAEVLKLQSLVDARKSGQHLLDWSPLGAIDDEALAPLAALFTAWTLQPLALRMQGGGRLDGLLRSRTVSGERAASVHWWRLRMEWLRLMRRPDEFDLVALDYCITYEVSPPAWRDAACDATAADAAALAADFSRTDSGLSTIPDGVLAGPPAAGVLSGVITGDATDLLASFDMAAPGDVVVDCTPLVRIDFAATGSVLNWAVAQQTAGRQVRFTGLHRLVAAFFNLIGVGEHATILSRRS
ncbi:STAS domain-containing protein [Pseudorhodoferax sp. Leaf267]|uniref:STAS domain-containing protein n=1 Tax=Pseudorhodoferax sp. Leaf267 TaxID=1736316 RepID=UPI0006F3E842|nr:STAS domain-containing protein [Pseudorhodoferax sp. Leaf267]KQP14126.1 hypothetical protein ASF43_14905 [Pseudorhodoferax sp. Leaf267]